MCKKNKSFSRWVVYTFPESISKFSFFLQNMFLRKHASIWNHYKNKVTWIYLETLKRLNYLKLILIFFISWTDIRSLQRVYKRYLWYLIVFKFKLMVIAISMLKELEGIFSQLIHLQLMKRDFGYQLLSWPQKDNLGNQESPD